MITARFALENNREVMAVPGRVDSPQSKGPHQLLRQGAVLVESPQDVLDALGQIGTCLQSSWDTASQQPAPDPVAGCRQASLSGSLSDVEKAVCEALSPEPTHIDQIVAATGLSAGQVSAALVCLQLKGMVRSLAGNLFIRRTAAGWPG